MYRLSEGRASGAGARPASLARVGPRRVMILPGRTTSGKGVGLANLLDDDPNFLARHGVKWWIGSSRTFESQTIESALRQGLHAVSNLYGASEFGLFAISCPTTSGDFHLGQGHVLVEVVDPSGKPVENGEFGRIVLTHLCGMDENGEARVHSGTQMLRLAVGDGAVFLSEPCACGLMTQRLRNIQRV